MKSINLLQLSCWLVFCSLLLVSKFFEHHPFTQEEVSSEGTTPVSEVCPSLPPSDSTGWVHISRRWYCYMFELPRSTELPQHLGVWLRDSVRKRVQKHSQDTASGWPWNTVKTPQESPRAGRPSRTDGKAEERELSHVPVNQVENLQASEDFHLSAQQRPNASIPSNKSMASWGEGHVRRPGQKKPPVQHIYSTLGNTRHLCNQLILSLYFLNFFKFSLFFLELFRLKVTVKVETTSVRCWQGLLHQSRWKRGRLRTFISVRGKASAVVLWLRFIVTNSCEEVLLFKHWKSVHPI